ncbi:hypothetical protein RQP46_011327 [Phenoliferia psychrophenolica]
MAFSSHSRNHLVTPLDLTSLDVAELKRTWQACSEVKRVLDQGSRFENLNWRLWYMESTNKGGGWSDADKGKGKVHKVHEDVLEAGQPMDWSRPQQPSTSAWGTLFMDHIQTQAQQQQQQQVHGASRPTPSGSMDSLLLNNPTLSSAATFSPPQAAPTFPTDDYSALFSQGPLFHSSYGAYQPVTGPLARFLTPSPGPSLLGNFEDLADGLADFRREEADANAGDRSYESIWQDFDRGANAQGEDGGGDPFAGMALAGRSGDTSPANGTSGSREGDATGYAMDLEALARRIEAERGPGHESELESLERLAASVADRDGGRPANGNAHGDQFEQSTRADHPPLPPILPRGFNPNDAFPSRAPTSIPAFPSMHFLDHAASYASTAYASGHASTSEPSPRDLDPSGALDQDRPGTLGDGPKKAAVKRAKAKKDDAPSKKNRNPHATQLPGSGARKLPKVEAAEGHEGPSCSHCASIATPLWRRGPDDELLCNACGLYQKLHSKPRPKAFGKQGSKARASSGAAAQAAASSTPPMCNNCSATSTPMWRRDPDGNLACNACSLYFKLHNVRYARSPVSNDRDRDLPTPEAKRVKVDESWERAQLPFSSAGVYEPGASAMGSTAGFS